MHLLHVFPSFEVGGAQVRLARLMNDFGRRYRHSVLAMDGVDPFCGTTMRPF